MRERRGDARAGERVRRFSIRPAGGLCQREHFITRKRRRTEGMEYAGPLVFVLLVETFEPGDRNGHDVRLDERIHKALERPPLLLFDFLVRFFVVLILKAFRVHPLLQHLDDGGRDVGIFMREEVGKGVGG